MTKKIQTMSLAEDLITEVCLGRHNNTVRIGDKYKDLKEGPAVFVSAETGTEIPVTITKIDSKPFARINKKDAEEQGVTVADLKGALKDIHYRHAHVTGRTQTYIVHIAPPDVSKDIQLILEAVSAQVEKEGFDDFVDATSVFFNPDFKANRHELAFVTPDAEIAYCLSNIAYKTFGSDGFDRDFEFTRKKEGGKKLYSLTLKGDMAALGAKLEKAYPPPQGVIKGPIPL